VHGRKLAVDVEEVMRSWPILAMLFVPLLVGCSQSDEENPTTDEPPRILSTNPILGVQQLSYGNFPNYFEVTLEEPNVDQTLFWRLVVSYDGEQGMAMVLVTEGAAERIFASPYDPASRQLTAIYSPCDTLEYDLEGRSGTLYVGVSDRPFLRPLGWPYKTSEIGEAFLLDEDRPVAVVSWPIKIVGNNNCLHF